MLQQMPVLMPPIQFLIQFCAFLTWPGTLYFNIFNICIDLVCEAPGLRGERWHRCQKCPWMTPTKRFARKRFRNSKCLPRSLSHCRHLWPSLTTSHYLAHLMPQRRQFGCGMPGMLETALSFSWLVSLVTPLFDADQDLIFFEPAL